MENVLNTLRHLNVSKGTGLDKIPAKMLRIAANITATSLTYIFNLSISTGVFVDNWNDLKDNNLKSKFQSGFRSSGRSTITALIQMCNNWYENMDNGKLTGMVFIDIRKAFDSIDHATLLQTLACYGVSQLEHTLFQSYLVNRQQQCQVNGFLSTKMEIICGVSQGSLLGPLFFLVHVYINDLPRTVVFSITLTRSNNFSLFLFVLGIDLFGGYEGGSFLNLYLTYFSMVTRPSCKSAGCCVRLTCLLNKIEIYMTGHNCQVSKAADSN